MRRFRRGQWGGDSNTVYTLKERIKFPEHWKRPVSIQWEEYYHALPAPRAQPFKSLDVSFPDMGGGYPDRLIVDMIRISEPGVLTTRSDMGGILFMGDELYLMELTFGEGVLKRSMTMLMDREAAYEHLSPEEMRA